MSEAAEAPDEALEPDAIVPEAAASEDPPQAAKPDKARSQIEAAARQAGWAPADEWKGDPGDHLDAPEFILKAVGEVLPSMRKTLKEVKDENVDLRKAVKGAVEHISRAEQKGYDKAVRELQGRIAVATESGDAQGALEAAGELVELTKEASAAKPAERPPESEPEEVTAWKAENPWFGKDAAMRGAAIEIVNELVADGVKDPGKQLEIVSRRIKAEFPHKFENPNRKLVGAVEGGQPNRKPAAKTWADLSPEQKEMGDFFAKTLKKFSREQYVKDTFGATR